MTATATAKATRNMIFLVLVASLGYFVDIYDLFVFSIVRKPSLLSIGVAASDILPKGQFIINVQMFGLLLGGILWGVIGDKLGRIKVLFGSILLYSIAPINIAFNAFVVHYGMVTSGYIMMGILTVISLFSLSQLKETFGKDLNYVEIS